MLNKKLRKVEEANEDLKVKSLALASQKQILQMRYRFNSTPTHQHFIGTESPDLDKDDDEQDLDSLLIELKDSVSRFQSENERLKRDLDTANQGLEAERRFYRESQNLDLKYDPDTFERNRKELEYLIQNYGLNIRNEKDYLRQICQPNGEKGKVS